MIVFSAFISYPRLRGWTPAQAARGVSSSVRRERNAGARHDSMRVSRVRSLFFFFCARGVLFYNVLSALRGSPRVVRPAWFALRSAEASRSEPFGVFEYQKNVLFRCEFVEV